MNILFEGNKAESAILAFILKKKEHRVFSLNPQEIILQDYSSEEQSTLELESVDNNKIDLIWACKLYKKGQISKLCSSYPGIPVVVTGLAMQSEMLKEIPKTSHSIGAFVTQPAVESGTTVIWNELSEESPVFICGLLEASGEKNKALELLKQAEVRFDYTDRFTDFLLTQRCISCSVAGALASAGFNNYAAAADNYIIRIMVKGLRETLNMIHHAKIKPNPPYYNTVRSIPSFLLIKQFERVVGAPSSELALGDYSQYNQKELIIASEQLLTLAKNTKYKLKHFNLLCDLLNNPPEVN